MKKLLSITIACVAFTLISSAQADHFKQSQHAQGRMHHHRMMMAKQLNLTEAQKQQSKAIHQEFKAKADALKANDKMTVGDFKKQMAALRKEQKEKMQSVLTPEQKQKLKEAGAKMKEERVAKQQKHLDRLKQELSLTDAQMNTIKNNREAFQNRIKAIKDNTSLAPEQKRVQLKEIQKSRKSTFESTLTAEQKTKLEDLKNKFK